MHPAFIEAPAETALPRSPWFVSRFSFANAQGELLHACESLDGVSIGMGNNYEESKLFLSHAGEHVTEGVATIGAVAAHRRTRRATCI